MVWCSGPHGAGLGVVMEAWTWGLLLKPLIGIVIVAGLVFGAKAVAWVIYKLMPDCKLKRELFRTAPAGNADGSANPPKGLLK